MQPIIIVFSPGGGVPGYLVGGQPTAASCPLYLSVGKVEKVGAPPAPYPAGNNLIDLQSYWVGVNNQTGLVSTAENAGTQPYDPSNTGAVTAALNESRAFVRKALSTGAR